MCYIHLCATNKHTNEHTYPRSLERLIEQLKAIMLFIVMSITRLILCGCSIASGTYSNGFDPLHVRECVIKLVQLLSIAYANETGWLWAQLNISKCLLFSTFDRSPYVTAEYPNAYCHTFFFFVLRIIYISINASHILQHIFPLTTVKNYQA